MAKNTTPTARGPGLARNDGPTEKIDLVMMASDVAAIRKAAAAAKISPEDWIRLILRAELSRQETD